MVIYCRLCNTHYRETRPQTDKIKNMARGAVVTIIFIISLSVSAARKGQTFEKAAMLLIPAIFSPNSKTRPAVKKTHTSIYLSAVPGTHTKHHKWEKD